MHELLVQGVGFLGVLCTIFAFQIKSNRALFVMQLIGCMMFCTQFALLNSLSGTYSLFVAMARNIIILNQKKHKWANWKGWIAILCTASVIVTACTWQGPISILPFIPVFSCHFINWTNNAQKIRLGNLVLGSPPWIIYDIIVGSYAGLINETICLSSILISIYRYGWNALANDEDFK